MSHLGGSLLWLITYFAIAISSLSTQLIGFIDSCCWLLASTLFALLMLLLLVLTTLVVHTRMPFEVEEKRMNLQIASDG